MKYSILILILSGLLNSICLEGQGQTETRSLRRSFAVNEKMSLEITNKYGKVHVSPATNDSVVIRIEMEASAASHQKLRKLVDGISFDFSSTNYFVIAKTNFINGPANIIESLRSITNNLISSDSRIEINYFIDAPPYVKIKIDNRYGDIFIESMDNDFDVKLSNGSITCDDLPGISTFNLDFYDATFNTLGKSAITATYGDMNIGSADVISFNTTASRIDMDRCGEMKLLSKRDRLKLKECGGVNGESYFSDFTFDNLDGDLNLTAKYGTINIDEIGNNVQLINLESSFTSLYTDIMPGNSFNIDAKLHNCPVTYPGDWDLEEEYINTEKNESLLTGHIGNRETDSRIILDSTRGKIVFMNK